MGTADRWWRAVWRGGCALAAGALAGLRGGRSRGGVGVSMGASAGMSMGLLVVGLLAGCAAPPPAAPLRLPPPPLADALFGPPTEPVDTAGLLALSPAMQAFAQSQLRQAVRQRDPASALAAALYRVDGLQLHYEGGRTRTPAEAFAARRGNCLSLALMTGAFARALGIDIAYQLVQAAEVLDRRDDLVLRSGHVNVELRRSALTETWQRSDRPVITVDFVPERALAGLRVRRIDEATLVAMYLNNRAAEALLAGAPDQAYAWARAAVLHPGDEAARAQALNTLGVVYQRAGLPAWADRAYAAALARAPQLTAALANRVPVLHQLGRHDEALANARQLAALEPEPPFQALDEGRAALQRGDAAAALPLLARAAGQHPDLPEAQFWLAQAQYRLGALAPARAAMARAAELSLRETDRARYTAKLAWLTAQGAQGAGP